MKRSSASLVLLLLLLSALPLAHAGRGALFFPQTGQIGLGYSPSTVIPVSQGVPIYTQGDEIWVESYYNKVMQLQIYSPGYQNSSALTDLVPGQLLELYVFGEHDPAGWWTLAVAPLGSTGQNASIAISVVSPDSSMVPSYKGANLTGDFLRQVFALPPTQAYDMEACSLGSGQVTGSGATFGVSGVVNGTLSVILGRNESSLTFPQSGSALSAWLELHSQYSYIVGGATDSQDLLVAKSPVFTSGGSAGSEVFSFADQMPLRSGRFDLRVFERTASGLSVQEAQFLRFRNGTWLSLGGCTSLVNVNSQRFTLSANLDSGTESWPRGLITMYAFNGIESYSESGLPSNESVIHVKVSPGGAPLTGVTFAASSEGGQLKDWDAFNSAIYVLLGNYPSNISIGISFSGVVVRTVNATVSGPFSTESVSIQAGTLTASVTLNGEAFTNASISVSAPGGPPILIPQTTGGRISILLPPGTYTVTASYEGTKVSEGFTISAGQLTNVGLELSPPGFPITLAALATLGVVVVAANIIVWRRYLERRRISI